MFDQTLEDVVEQRDLVVGDNRPRRRQKQIGDAAQRFDAASDGAVRERGLQFIEQVRRAGADFEFMS